MKPLESYLQNTSPWTSVVKNKHVLFDTNAIVGLMAYKAEGVFDEMQKAKITCCFIDPINIELLNTNDSKLRIDRQSLLAMRGFYKLPLDQKSLAKSTEIQAWLSTQKIFPSVADLYLGGRLAAFGHNDILLLTANLKDFPYPLYNREAYLLLQNERACSVYSFLSFNHSEI